MEFKFSDIKREYASPKHIEIYKNSINKNINDPFEVLIKPGTIKINKFSFSGPFHL